MIKRCSCRSDFQDKRYGIGNRVHNQGTQGKASCTVCGKDTSAGLVDKRAKKAA
jgi:hypothetical protein